MTTWPSTSTPCTWKTDFAMSRPIVVITCMFGSSKLWGPNSTHCFGTYVPVEEPSTASITEVAVGALARFPIIPAAPLFASHRDLEWTFANVPVYEENRVKKVEACYRQLLKAME